MSGECDRCGNHTLECVCRFGTAPIRSSWWNADVSKTVDEILASLLKEEENDGRAD